MEDTTAKNEYEHVARLVESMDAIPNLTNQDKMNILLVFKGLKPATILEFVAPAHDEHANIEIAEYVQGLCELLQSQNFLVHKDCEDENANSGEEGFARDFNHYSVYTAKTPENLSMLVESDTEEDRKTKDYKRGKVLGYPDTAIHAWIDGNILKDVQELPEDVRDSGVLKFVNFRLSRDHWRDELEQVSNEALTVKEMSPALYDDILNG
jgi:hypothetical protein